MFPLSGSIPLTLTLVITTVLTATAGDWPEWGGSAGRNMVSPASGVDFAIDPGKRLKGEEKIDLDSTKGVRWAAKLGSQTYGTPTIAGGRVFVGTNNESPRDPANLGDRGVVYCFDETTGEFLWQLAAPKLGAGKVSDWEFLGICSSPTIVGDRGYVVTNRCEILCFDVKGLSDGNQGMEQEAAYKAGPGADPLEVTPHDADILWVYDMRSELGVFPHNIASSSVLVRGGKVFCTTSNGVDWSHTNIPAPNAPSLVVLDAQSGRYLGEQDPVVSSRVLHCSWSSPALGQVDGKDLLVFAAGDGWAYGLGTEAALAKGEDPNDAMAIRILPERWRFDCNAPEYRVDPETNEPIRYVDYEGPSECVGTPVVHGGLVYVCIGQDPEHGEGVGRISAIDPSGQGDLSGSQVWEFKGIGRSISTPSIADGVLYISDYSGRVYALDAMTGESFWEFDTKGHVWGSTLAVDGKVLIANEEGELYVLSGGKEGGEELALIEFPAPIYSSPVIGNGIVYVATQTHLYAFGKAEAQTPAPTQVESPPAAP